MSESISTVFAEPPPFDFETIRLSRRFERETNRAGTIYFIGYGDRQPVKIGFTTNLPYRVQTLQTASPYDLIVLATLEGSIAHEWAYHDRFREHLMRGEWFAPHPDILAEIERLATVLHPPARR